VVGERDSSDDADEQFGRLGGRERRSVKTRKCPQRPPKCACHNYMYSQRTTASPRCCCWPAQPASSLGKPGLGTESRAARSTRFSVWRGAIAGSRIALLARSGRSKFFATPDSTVFRSGLGRGPHPKRHQDSRPFAVDFFSPVFKNHSLLQQDKHLPLHLMYEHPCSPWLPL
jgi:hypothetical protein